MPAHSPQRLAKFLLCILAVPLCVACGSRSSELSIDGSTIPSTAIIFIPGFKGSVLVEEDGTIAWLDALGALGFASSLVLDDNGDLGFSNARKLHPLAVLNGVPVIPWLYTEHLYDRWIEFLKAARPEAAVLPFAYDWRRDNWETVKQLSDFIASVRSAGAEHVILVGHSMGAVISAYYLRYGAQPPESAMERWNDTIDGVVLIAAPFKGAVKMVRDIENGSTTFLNDDLLDGDALASFPSSYQLLPANGFSPIMDSSLRRNDVDWFDVTVWIQNKLGLLKIPSGAYQASREKFLQKSLQRGADWSRRINEVLQGREPKTPILNLVAKGNVTLNALIMFSEGNLSDDLKQLPASLRQEAAKSLASDGDGTVTTDSAALPGAFMGSRSEVVSIAATHDGVLKDPEAQRFVKKFLDGILPPSPR